MPASAPEPAAPGGTAPLAGRYVARIGYGVMQLVEHAVTPDDAVAVLRLAVELGVNHLDTARFYGLDVANGLIRDALYPYPHDLLIATKVGAERAADGALVAAQRPEQLRADVEANLRTLRVERLGVVNLRRLDGGAGIRASGEQIVDLDDQLAELAALRDDGLIAGIGLSNVTADQVEHALPVGIACVQNAYNLLDRTDEAELELCRRHGVAWVPFFPLGSAFPGRPKVTDQPAVVAAAGSLGVTPAQVGLAWLLGHAPNILLIPGTGTPAHLRENVGAGAVRLDAAVTAALDGVAPSR